jgi:hypothetical protein
MVHNITNLMVSVQHRAGSADDDINFCWWMAKTIAGNYMRVTLGKWMVEDQKLDPDLHQDTLGKPTSRAIH